MARTPIDGLRRAGAGAAVAFTLVAAAAVARAAEPVDLELVLAVDASASVDYEEFQLQMLGLAAAFRDPAVIEAIGAAAPNGIAVSLVQWSGADAQLEAVGFARVDDAASAEAFAARIDAAPRLVIGGATAIGAALAHAHAALEANAYAGARRVIDVSGDGRSNQGPSLAAARERALAAGVTINALAVLDEVPDLEAYYARAVIGGAAAFTLTAADYGAFARAIRLKLEREIRAAPLARSDGMRARRRAAAAP